MDPANLLPAPATPRGLTRSQTVQLALAAAGVVVAVGVIFALGTPHPHAFDTALFARQPLVIQVHLLAAVTALMLGLIQFARPKGTTVHRVIGWGWVLLMMTVSISSFAMLGLGIGISPIHALSAFVLVVVPLGVYAARRGQVDAHRGYMTGVFVFGLIVAGAFTFVPGRLMWRLFLG
jgi:uncharacterized membrane protein